MSLTEVGINAINIDSLVLSLNLSVSIFDSIFHRRAKLQNILRFLLHIKADSFYWCILLLFNFCCELSYSIIQVF